MMVSSYRMLLATTAGVSELDIMEPRKALENKASHAYISVGINYTEGLDLHKANQPVKGFLPVCGVPIAVG
jgi:hypothetical protein